MGVGGLWQRSGEELLREVAEVEARMRRDYAVSLALIGELDSRGVVAEVGYPNLGVLLRDVVRISSREVNRRLAQARVVVDRPVVSGGTVPALLPVAGAAARDGVLGGEHLGVITAAIGALPAHVSDQDREFAERTLVDAARELDPARLAAAGVGCGSGCTRTTAPTSPNPPGR